jgi:release factor glutamine methyltransferase
MDIWGVNRISQAIEARSIARNREAASLAQWVWEDILKKRRGSNSPLTKDELDLMESVFERMSTGEPVQYIAGHAYFYGRKFKVSPGVLIPRPETEELVEWVYADFRDAKRPLRILDIGTGSGCIAIMVKLLLGDRAEVIGIDISADALAVAEFNSKALAAEVMFLHHDFVKKHFAGLGQFDVIISNPPYISATDVGDELKEALRFEPVGALYPVDPDPDIFYKIILAWAKDYLHEGGTCFLEINEFRKEQMESIVASTGWESGDFRKDLQGQWRMLRIKK